MFFLIINDKVYYLNLMTSEQKEKKDENKMIVTPWDTSGKIDYNKLVIQFGTTLIDDALLEKFKKVTGKDLHPWMKRGIFFTHRSFDVFLDAYANGEPVFLYTGRGPSTDAMHIGHLIPFLFTKWLQDVFDCPLVIQISDEEKAAFKQLDFNVLHEMGIKNAKEIISCGFNPKKTFIFSNRDYRLRCPQYENFTSDMKNNTSMKLIQSIFGLQGTGNIAMYDWPVYQSAAAFYQAYPHIFGNRPAYCLVPHAIDQDPYFRLARDAASKMNLIKPCNIECTFIPPLTGQDGKMSSSKAEATLFLDDTEEILRKKIMTLCLSGADPDPEVHKKKGGNVDMDIAYQYLKYFEYDDKRLEEIKEGFTKGTISAVEIKEILVQSLYKIMKQIQDYRKTIDDKLIEDFYAQKPMDLPKPKMKEPTKEESKLYEYLVQLKIQYTTKYHVAIITKDQAEDLARMLEGTICKGILLKSKEGYIYYIINEQTTVNPKTLSKKIGAKNLKFAESDTYKELLEVNSKTCPTPFALMNTKGKKGIIKVLIDENIANDQSVNFLAMREDGTCTISYKDMITFVESLQYKITYVKE